MSKPTLAEADPMTPDMTKAINDSARIFATKLQASMLAPGKFIPGIERNLLQRIAPICCEAARKGFVEGARFMHECWVREFQRDLNPGLQEVLGVPNRRKILDDLTRAEAKDGTYDLD